MAADQNRDASLPDPNALAAEAQRPATDPAELTDTQLDAVAGGAGAMQMMQMSTQRSVRPTTGQWGDPHESGGGE